MKRSFIKYLSLTLLLIMVFTGGMSAQKKSGDIFVVATYETDLKEGNRELAGIVFKQGRQKFIYGLDEAVVVLVQNSDTLKHLATGEDGRCVFKDIPYGKYHISISYVGFNSFEADFNHSSGKSNIEAPMVESSFILDAVKVKGNIPLTILKGDTIVVNPLAVQTKQGAAAIEIIKQVPGVEIAENGSITAFGKVLQRSYVGGNSLFGSNVLAALQGVDADLVKNIKFYDEYEHVATINGEHITQEVRVMNIETTRELLSSANGHLLAGAGRDIKNGGGDEKVRYKSGLSFNMYNKGLIINTNIYKNNVGLSSNKADYLSNLLSARTTGDKAIGYADIKIERNNGEVRDVVYSSLKVNYKYRDESILSELREEREYYDTEDYSDRKYESLSVKDIGQQSHDFSVTFNKCNKEGTVRSYSLGHSMRFNNNNNTSSMWQNESSDLANVNLEDISNQRVRNWSVTENASCNFRDNKLSLSGSFTIGESDGKGVRSVKESGMERIYEFTPIGDNIKASGRASVHMYGWSNNRYYGKLRLQLASSYNKEKRQEFRYDLGEVLYFDSLSSYYYSSNNFENSLELNIDYKRKGNGWQKGVTALLGLKQILISDDNRLYSTMQNKRYYTPIVQVDWGCGYILQALYKLNTSAPALEQLRDRVDDTNPLYLRVGNPNLKLTHNHYVRLNCYSNDPFRVSSYFQISLEGYLKQNVVVPYTEYYPLGGELEQCDNYPVMPGVTVQSYKNARNEYETKLSTSYSIRLRTIKTKVSAHAYGQYNKNYSYVQGKRNCTDKYAAYLKLKSETSYKRVSFSLMSASEYVFSSNSIREDYKYFNQRIGADLDLTLLKYWFVNSSYDLHFNMPIDGTIGVINRDNILNVSTGANLLKNRLRIGFSVFDIFNSSSSFRTMQYADYVQNNWISMFGRYYSFDIFFNLRKHKFSK